MNHSKVCQKCNSEMIKGSEIGYFAIIEAANPNIGKITKTNDYMCNKCGYIEIYAENPQFAG